MANFQKKFNLYIMYLLLGMANFQKKFNVYIMYQSCFWVWLIQCVHYVPAFGYGQCSFNEVGYGLSVFFILGSVCDIMQFHNGTGIICPCSYHHLVRVDSHYHILEEMQETWMYFVMSKDRSLKAILTIVKLLLKVSSNTNNDCARLI